MLVPKAVILTFGYVAVGEGIKGLGWAIFIFHQDKTCLVVQQRKGKCNSSPHASPFTVGQRFSQTSVRFSSEQTHGAGTVYLHFASEKTEAQIRVSPA